MTYKPVSQPEKKKTENACKHVPKGRSLIKLYSYTKVAKGIRQFIAIWYENGTPITNIIRQINPKLRKTLPQMDLADMCIFLIIMVRHHEINEVKRWNTEGSEKTPEYTIDQMKKYVAAWGNGWSREQCHRATKALVADSVKFGNRLFRCLNRKFRLKKIENTKVLKDDKEVAIEVETAIQRSNRILLSEKPKRDLSRHTTNYTARDIERLEEESDMLIDEIKKLHAIFGDFFAAFRLARMNSDNPNSFIIFFKDLPIELRQDIMNIFPFLINTLTYPEKLELSLFADDWRNKNPKKRYSDSMSLEQAEVLYEIDRSEEERHLTRRVMSEAYPRLALARKITKLESVGETNERMTVVEADMRETENTRMELRNRATNTLEAQQEMAAQLKEVEEKLNKAEEITTKTLRLVQYKNQEAAKRDTKLMSEMKILFLTEEEQKKLLTEDQQIEKETKLKKLKEDIEENNTTENEITDEIIPFAREKNPTEITEDELDVFNILDDEVELALRETLGEIERPKQPKLKPPPSLIKTAENTANEIREARQKEKLKALEEERSIPLKERLKRRLAEKLAKETDKN